MAAAGLTTSSLSALALTASLSRDTTATCENSAPLGFQHLVQPHTWLCALCALTVTLTGRSSHLQTSVPPAKSFAVGLMPWSTAGWIETAMAGLPFCLTFPVVFDEPSRRRRQTGFV